MQKATRSLALILATSLVGCAEEVLININIGDDEQVADAENSPEADDEQDEPENFLPDGEGSDPVVTDDGEILLDAPIFITCDVTSSDLSAVGMWINPRTMELAASAPPGSGVCIDHVMFQQEAFEVSSFYMPFDSDELVVEPVVVNGFNRGCETEHCGTLLHEDGTYEQNACSLYAFCDERTGLALALAFDW